MGDMADDLTEQGFDMWMDDKLGHPRRDYDFGNDCPYCYEAIIKKTVKKVRKNGKQS